MNFKENIPSNNTLECQASSLKQFSTAESDHTGSLNEKNGCVSEHTVRYRNKGEILVELFNPTEQSPE